MIDIKFDSMPETIVETAKHEIVTKQGGTLTGDTKTGKFSLPLPVGKVEGSYTITGQMINIFITKKPIFVPESVIKSKLQEFLK